MRIAAMAAGAVGGYFGGAHGGGRPRRVLHRARRQSRGASARTASRSRACTATCICRRSTSPTIPKSVGPVDIVLFAVKLWDTETAAELARPLVGPDTRVITLQNGVDSVERMAPILGAEQTVGGAAYIATVIDGARRHQAHQQFATHALRPRRRQARRHARRPSPMPARRPSIDIDISADIDRERWQKFIFLTAMSGATAALRSPIGPIAGRSGTARLLPQADGGGLRGRPAPRAWRSIPTTSTSRMDFVATKVEPGMKASMAHDLERGNRLELDWLAGKVRELGRALNIPTPASDTVYTVLKLHRMGIVDRHLRSVANRL